MTMASKEAGDNIENTEKGEEPKPKRVVHTLDHKVQLVPKAEKMVHVEKFVCVFERICSQAQCQSIPTLKMDEKC